MKKIVLTFGLIAGLIFTGFMIYFSLEMYKNPNFKSNDIIGYAGMIAVFSLMFVGIKNYRDKYNDGIISFGKAFKTGFYIAFIASSMYVGVWLIEYYLFIPDFLDKYISLVLKNAEADGASQAELAKKTREMASFKKMYENPLFVILISYLEILPIGVIVAFISALILKRKTYKPAIAQTNA